MTVETLAPFLWGAGGRIKTREQLQREREIADALIARGADFSPVAHPLQGAARVATALAGAYRGSKADRALAAKDEADAQLRTGLFAGGLPRVGDTPDTASVTSTSVGTLPNDAAIHAGRTVPRNAYPGRSSAEVGMGAIPDSYYASIRAAESSGDDNAKNSNSTATGRYQFTQGTWADLARTRPDLGLTPDGRLDPEQQERAIRAFTDQNAKILTGNSLPVDNGTLYAMHFLGAGDGPMVLREPDATHMTSLVSQEVIQANPFLADMTVGEFRQWAARKGGMNQAGVNGSPSVGTGAQNNGAPDPAMAYSPSPRQAVEQAFDAVGIGEPSGLPQDASQTPAPASVAGMNYDPSTGRVGPAAGLNEGANLAPAARQAFQEGSPAFGEIARLLSGGGNSPVAGNPTAGASGPALGTLATASAPGMAPQGVPSPGGAASSGGGLSPSILAALTSPDASPETRQIAMALYQRQLDASKPRAPIEVNGRLVDPQTFEVVADFSTPQKPEIREVNGRLVAIENGTARDITPEGLTGGYRAMTPEERTSYGVAGDIPAFIGPDGKPSFGPARASTSVTVGGENSADGKLRAKLGEKEGERWSVLKEAGLTSGALTQDFQLLDELLKVAPQGPISGRLAETFKGFSTAGDAFQSIVKRVAPSLRTPGSGATSDIEYQGMLDSLPRLANDPTANRLIAEMMKAKGMLNVERARIVTAFENEELSAADARRRLSELDSRSIMSPQLRAVLGDVVPSGAGAPATPDPKSLSDDELLRILQGGR